MSEFDLDYFLGTWIVERSIEDARGQESGAFEGTATFSPEGDGLRFDEVGIVRFAAYRGRATRRLYYARGEEGSLHVSFADGHHFVALCFLDGATRDLHHCGQDLYEITTVVVSPDHFEEVWRVHGPAKHYRATTGYSRVRD